MQQRNGHWATSNANPKLRIERLLSRIVIAPTGCWIWTGSKTLAGYGQMRVPGAKVYVHRVSYEWFVGPIPEGLVMDHTCHSSDPTCSDWDTCPHRACVNPDHLEPVTAVVNLERSHGRHGTETHCPHGHSYADAIRKRDGSRVCRECSRIRSNAAYLRRKARKSVA